MNKFLLPPLLVFLEFIFTSIYSLPWSLFDSLLTLVIIYTFFHSLDMKDFVVFALFCGFLRDIFSLDIFGVYMFSYLISSFCVSLVSVMLNRDNWFFIFPLVFLGTFLNNHIILISKFLFFGSPYQLQANWFFIRNLTEAGVNTLLAYPFYLFSKKCALEVVR